MEPGPERWNHQRRHLERTRRGHRTDPVAGRQHQLGSKPIWAVAFEHLAGRVERTGHPRERGRVRLLARPRRAHVRVQRGYRRDPLGFRKRRFVRIGSGRCRRHGVLGIRLRLRRVLRSSRRQDVRIRGGVGPAHSSVVWHRPGAPRAGARIGRERD